MLNGEQTSPSGGSTAVGGDRGAFPLRRRRGCMVFAAKGSAAAGGKILIARKGDTTTLSAGGAVKSKNPHGLGPCPS